MKKQNILVIPIIALGAVAAAISDPEFTGGGAGWTTYTGGSGSVSFADGNTCQLTAFVSSLAGVEQAETAFNTTGQEYRLTVNVLNNGNVLAGWRNASEVNLVTTTYASGATGIRTIDTDDKTYNLVFVEKTGAIGGIINVDYMRTSVITAPPTFAGAAGATRSSATSATLTWAAGSDNVTPVGSIVYNIWYSTNSGNIFVGAPQATVTGTTSAFIAGLTSNAQVFFGVRAEDRVGNRELNTVQVNIPSGAGVGDWRLY